MTMQKDVPDRTPYEGRFMPSGRGRTWMGTPTCDVAAYMGKTESNLLISLEGDRPGKPDADLLYCDAPDDLTGSRMSRIRRTKLVSHRCVKWMMQTCRTSDKAGWEAIEAAFPFKRRQGGHGDVQATDDGQDDQIVPERLLKGSAPQAYPLQTIDSKWNFDPSKFRTGLLNGEPAIAAQDLVEALDGTWSGGEANFVPEKWRGLMDVETAGGIQRMVGLTEPGMNKYLIRSNMPKAGALQDFISETVLPSIRRTGSYGAPKVMSDDELLNRAYLLAHERYKKAEASIETEWKPKVASLEMEKAKEEQARLQAEDVADRERVARASAEAEKEELKPKAEAWEGLRESDQEFRIADVAAHFKVPIPFIVDLIVNKLHWAYRYNGKGHLLAYKPFRNPPHNVCSHKLRDTRQIDVNGDPMLKESIRITGRGMAEISIYLKKPFSLVA